MRRLERKVKEIEKILKRIRKVIFAYLFCSVARGENLRQEFFYKTIHAYLDRRYYGLRRVEMTLRKEG